MLIQVVQTFELALFNFVLKYQSSAAKKFFFKASGDVERKLFNVNHNFEYK